MLKEKLKKLFLALTKHDFKLGLSLLVSMTVFGTLACSVVIPAHENEISRVYKSRLGYPAIQRRLGNALEVTAESVKTHQFESSHLGEGTMAAQSVLVPVIPMSRVSKLYVEEGDYVEKGDVLLELDTSLASIKLSSAKLALETASSELDRVSIGSAYILAQERPEKDRLALSQAKEESNILAEQVAMHRKLYKSGAVSKGELLELELRLSEARKKLQSSKFHLNMSTQGQKKSMNIATNSLSDARNKLNHEQQELGNYKVLAPASGYIEKVLIREGEYNQDSGRPGFVIASGLWFEAHLDQAALAEIRKGDVAKVFLAAYKGREFIGKVTRIKPIVSFNAGGPETTRPIRPRGSATPEWPSTFTVRIFIEEGQGKQLVPGLTGFARIETQTKGLAVPASALNSLDSSSAIVKKLTAGGSFELVKVGIGKINGNKAEILSGLVAEDVILSRGHRELRMGDNFVIVEPEREGDA